MRVASVAFTNYAADPRVRRMSEALAERGDQVDAVTLRQEGDRAEYTLSGVRVHGIAIEQYKGTNVVAYVMQYLRFLIAATWVLTKLHVKHRFDVIHVNNMPDFLVFCAVPARLTGAKVILDLHDPMPELFAAKFSGSTRHPLVRLVTAVERLSIAFADRAIAVQQVHIDTFVAHGNPRSKFTEVQNAADTRLFPVGAAMNTESRDGVRVVYHGTIAPRLGLDTLVRAAAIVHDRHPDVAFVLIGDGDDGARIQEMIQNRDLGSVVDFRRGFVPVDQLLAHLEHADIGVVPAGRDPFTEGMLPSKLLEYVTLGIPSVSADLPGVRRYFDDDAVAYFPPGDADQLAQRLIELIEDPADRDRRAKRALQFLNDHGWPAERQRYFDLVDALVDT